MTKFKNLFLLYVQVNLEFVCFFCFFCCFTSKVNSYGHGGTVSSPNHTFFLGKLEHAVNQFFVHKLSLVTDNNLSSVTQQKGENDHMMLSNTRVKSGKFGRSAKFVQRPCLFHILIIGIKNKLTKQTVKILMRRLIMSRLIWISTVCKCMSEFT